MLYTPDGVLRAEDARLRRVARSQVHSALAQVEAKTAHLVERLVNSIDASLTRQCTAEQLLAMVQNHRCLQSEQALINRYTDAFPELQERVSHQRNQMLAHALKRIEDTLAPFEHGRRFAYTTGLRRH